MDPIRVSLASASPSFPRTRGDGPVREAPTATYSRFSPHPRGWTLLFTNLVKEYPVFPAPAGMDRPACGPSGCGSSFPRTRGDGPPGPSSPSRSLRVFPAPAGMDRLRLILSRFSGRFPRTRGDGPVLRLVAVPSRGVFPAPAGMDRTARPHSWTRRGFPRTRGDGPSGTWVSMKVAKFSPHPRGWT